MGTQQTRQGHGRQGSRQQGQQSDRRPQQEGDLQRNKQSDRGQHEQQQGGDTSRQQGQQNVHGEGNYAASRQYDDATKAFTESGRVEPAAGGGGTHPDDEARKTGAPRSDADAREMAAAETEGKRHSKGEDPALNRKASQKAPESPDTPRPGQEEE
jgi:hypothetical protein